MKVVVDRGNLLGTVEEKESGYRKMDMVYFDTTGTVTTDGRMAMHVQYPDKAEREVPEGAMISAVDARLMAKALPWNKVSGTKGVVEIGKTAMTVRPKADKGSGDTEVRKGSTAVRARLAEGAFPPWQEIIGRGEEEATRVVTVSLMLKLFRALEKAGVEQVRLTIKKDRTRSPGAIEFETTKTEPRRVFGAIMPCGTVRENGGRNERRR